MTPRIPPTRPGERDERTEELLAGMLRRPDGSEMNLFATLAHHPKLLKRWSAFGGTLLFAGVLPARDREILILRTAVHCGAEYEWAQHVGLGLAAGLTEDEIARVAGDDRTGWPENELALLDAADELHADCVITEATWERLAAFYDYPQLIEVCMVVGQYHLVAFTLNSLGVEPEPGLPEIPNRSG